MLWSMLCQLAEAKVTLKAQWRYNFTQVRAALVCAFLFTCNVCRSLRVCEVLGACARAHVYASGCTRLRAVYRGPC